MESKELNREIGKRVRELRQARYMSREWLSELMDVTVSHMRLIELGERGLTLVRCIKVSKIFYVSLDFIITGRVQKKFAKAGRSENAAQVRAGNASETSPASFCCCRCAGVCCTMMLEE